jgi:hypothetical protein
MIVQLSFLKSWLLKSGTYKDLHLLHYLRVSMSFICHSLVYWQYFMNSTILSWKFLQ